jgi:Flp pilus assembly protein TadD
MRGNLGKFAAVAMLTLVNGGCILADGSEPETSIGGGITDTSSFGSGPEQVWLDKAKGAYRNGNYGLAERYYRQAIEERHNNAEAWLGLAASYDQLKRFDHADRAYDALVKITGHTPTVLNNLAYHQMLKGDFRTARETLNAAAAADPKNPYIRNNMELLNHWEAKARKSG